MRFLLPLLLVLGCGTEETDITDTGEPVAAEAVEDVLYRYLQGSFDSVDQAAQDPANYYEISLEMCVVSEPSLGERVLYVEQAVMSTPDDPYRQRLYAVERVDETTAVSRVYEYRYPHVLVGLCDDPESADLNSNYIEEREGCGVVMTWDGERLSGGTEGQGCTSDLGGAAYASSEVSLDAEVLTSWDRGFDTEGQQVWGATAGPYVFVRRSELVLP